MWGLGRRRVFLVAFGNDGRAVEPVSAPKRRICRNGCGDAWGKVRGMLQRAIDSAVLGVFAIVYSCAVLLLKFRKGKQKMR